jgi:hypothetical protein
MNVAESLRERLAPGEWIPFIYSDRIRSQRTRSVSIEVTERENRAEIIYTLLGIELKVGNRRISCPDLATARYIRVFARLGCRVFAAPYDITRVGPAADELEVAWQKSLIVLDELLAGRSSRARTQYRSAVIRRFRNEINEIGPGEAMPAFDRPTKQRTPL